MFKNNTDLFDQHFLIDEDIINKYLSYPQFNNNDIVVEIGPGKGILTSKIAPIVKKMYAIEIDTRLKEYLDIIPNLEVIYNNVLDTTIPKCNKLITSLPYSIIEPFIIKLINVEFNEMYMLMGSNYIDNVLNKKITRLSIITNCYFNMEKLLDVSETAFDYPPRTLSYIVKMTKINESNLDNKYKIYRGLIYRQDKKVKNALQETLISIKGLTKRESKELINNLNIPNNILEDKFETISNEKLVILDKYIELL